MRKKRGGAAMVGAPRRRFNLIGTLGFIFAVIGSFAKEQWFPWDRYVFWGLGVVFSFIGPVLEATGGGNFRVGMVIYLVCNNVPCFVVV
jgi:hypothetical protein